MVTGDRSVAAATGKRPAALSIRYGDVEGRHADSLADFEEKLAKYAVRLECRASKNVGDLA